MAKLFSKLPTFSADERRLLEADVAEGMLFLPQLMRTRSGIFHCQGNINYKYLAYIPFTRLAMNRHNDSPLSNQILWETMMIALLDYELDEFMEINFGQDEELQELEAIKSIVRRLCSFPGSIQEKEAGCPHSITNGHYNGA